MGTDPLSEGMIRRWQEEGVDTSLVLRDSAHQPGLYLIQLDERGERTFLYWRNDSAARYLLQHPGFAAVEAELAKLDMVYVSGISLAILPPTDRELLLTMLETLHAQGVEIAFDSNYRPTLWPSEQAARDAYARILAITSLALVTNDDEAALWGDSSSRQTLTRLKKAGVARAVVKQGADGCLYQQFDKDPSPLMVPAVFVDKVVDTTSAGDAFNAGFLAGYLCGKSPTACALQGHHLAATVIRHRGAIIPVHATAEPIANFNHLD